MILLGGFFQALAGLRAVLVAGFVAQVSGFGVDGEHLAVLDRLAGFGIQLNPGFRAEMASVIVDQVTTFRTDAEIAFGFGGHFRGRDGGYFGADRSGAEMAEGGDQGGGEELHLGSPWFFGFQEPSRFQD